MKLPTRFFLPLLIALAATAQAAPKDDAPRILIDLGAGLAPIVSYEFSGERVLEDGRRRGDFTLEPLAVTRETDGLSPLLFRAFALGLAFPAVTLVDGPVTIILERANIVGYSSGAGPDGAKTPGREYTETIELVGETIEYSYGGEAPVCLDLEEGGDCY